MTLFLNFRSKYFNAQEYMINQDPYSLLKIRFVCRHKIVLISFANTLNFLLHLKVFELDAQVFKLLFKQQLFRLLEIVK